MNNNENTFTNKNTLIAIVLSAIVLFGWQYYLAKKYPNLGAKTTSTTLAPTQPAATAETPTAALVESKKPSPSEVPVVPTQVLSFSSDEVKFDLTNKGMGIAGLTLKKHLTREKAQTQIGLNGSIFEIRQIGQAEPLSFLVKEVSAGEYVGTATVGTAQITHKLKVGTDGHSFTHNISVQSAGPEFKGLVVHIPDLKLEHKSTSWLLPSFENQEFIVRSGTTTERITVAGTKEDIDKKMGSVSLIAIGSQYFAMAVADKSEIIPEAILNAKHDGKDVSADMVYTMGSGSNKMELNFISYAGPKDYYQLQKLDKNLIEIINFGFFSGIATVLLGILKWFYGFVGNWGWAIILLTLLVRMVVLPFNFFSYKSMKKMQKIQPLIQSLRERYKNDPQALNRETMNLMREQKVNPIGGCLPMLLQMPVFFALYQVLAQSIDLYQAPFIWWIHDLSLKDPYFILPILMGIAMWVQQKITPSTMDPAQQKIMQFMPILFSFMMISLPSGLTLYIFVSTLFGVIQQQIFMRDSKPTTVSIKEAKA